MVQSARPSLPLLFSFKQLVVGNGFLAGVRMDGHALLETDAEDGREETWITGIAPVGIAAGGEDRGFAFVEFRKAWTEVVFDLAAAARNFDGFRASCAEFFSSREKSMTSLWDEAVAAVRRDEYTDPTLPRGSADKQVHFETVDLSDLQKADKNEVENGLQVAA